MTIAQRLVLSHRALKISAGKSAPTEIGPAYYRIWRRLGQRKIDSLERKSLRCGQVGLLHTGSGPVATVLVVFVQFCYTPSKHPQQTDHRPLSSDVVPCPVSLPSSDRSLAACCQPCIEVHRRAPTTTSLLTVELSPPSEVHLHNENKT